MNPSIRFPGSRGFAALFLCILLAACGPKEPIRIGFLGGLTDRNLDNGQAGLAGVQLAVEQANRDGGIGGRLIELIPKDDAMSKDVAVNAARELVAAKVDAVVGPFTTGIGVAVMPVFDEAKTLVVSPTISGLGLYGKDDYMVRINRTTRDNGNDYAKTLVARGQKRIAVAFDTRNRAFSESWLTEFRRAVDEAGGALVAEVPYESQVDADFAGVVAKMVEGKPDGLVFVSGAIDVARLAQAARKAAPELPIAASEWAATEQLVELGGKMVEGLLIVMNMNRDDESPRFTEFREAHFKRFQRNPGYSTVAAYDAATVLITALRKRQSGETPKQAVLKYGPYQGLQQEIAFDANGDTPRKVFFNEIRDGRFQLLK